MASLIMLSVSAALIGNMNLFSNAMAVEMNPNMNNDNSHGYANYKSYGANYYQQQPNYYYSQDRQYEDKQNSYTNDYNNNYNKYPTKDKKYECRTGPFEGFFTSSVEFCKDFKSDDRKDNGYDDSYKNLQIFPANKVDQYDNYEREYDSYDRYDQYDNYEREYDSYELHKSDMRKDDSRPIFQNPPCININNNVGSRGEPVPTNGEAVQSNDGSRSFNNEDIQSAQRTDDLNKDEYSKTNPDFVYICDNTIIIQQIDIVNQNCEEIGLTSAVSGSNTLDDQDDVNVTADQNAANQTGTIGDVGDVGDGSPLTADNDALQAIGVETGRNNQSNAAEINHEACTVSDVIS